jgi:LuxR family maltose regulon positive regulatory protein
MIRMVDAYEALVLRKPDARSLLAHAFASPRARQYYDSFETNAAFGATMCALALEHDVETEFVRRIIEVHRLAPPPEAGGAWPWAIKVGTLGAFELACNGKPLAVPGKAQKKPLELLKAMVAAGSRGVDKQRLADALWPDADAGAAAAALDMAISRLRKLLGVPQAIRIEDGKVDLDPAYVWVDAVAFDRDVEALQSALHKENPDAAEVDAIGRRILAGYRGAFLANEEAQRWFLSARDRWHHRFLRCMADAGQYWERRGAWAEATRFYERGIDVDTLSEDLYRRLMRCHLAQGQPAEAARVYRRCREMLSVQLGIAPSPDTEALFQAIYAR